MQKGFSAIIGIVIIVVIAFVAIGGIFAYQYFFIKPVATSSIVQQILNKPFPLAGEPTDQTAGWKTYINTEYGFEFKYPSNWVVIKTTNGVSLTSPERKKKYDECDPPKQFCGSEFDFYVVTCSAQNGINYDCAYGLNLGEYRPLGSPLIKPMIIGDEAGYEWLETTSNGGGYNFTVTHNNMVYSMGTQGEYNWETAPKTIKQIVSTFKFTTPTNQTAETPGVESDVTNQPTFLIAAYSNNGKNFIDVDYVTWLHGDASITAQVQDGKCASASVCQAFPNGYKQNLNPKIRTFEVPSSAPIIVNGEISSVVNEINQTHLTNPYGQNLSISFAKLKSAIATIKPWLTTSAQFKAPKAFITISVKNNIVTNITEPYQQ